MKVTLYIIEDMDTDYRLGREPVVRLWEPAGTSRMWINQVEVELPEGCEVAVNCYDEPRIFRDGRACEIAVNKAGEPVILSLKDNRTHIHFLSVKELPW